MIGDEFPDISNNNYLCYNELSYNDILLSDKKVVFFYPKTWTPICSQELILFNDFAKLNRNRNIGTIVITTDTIESINSYWYNSRDTLHYIFISDASKIISDKLGILHSKDMVPYRASYILINNVIRYIQIDDTQYMRSLSSIEKALNNY